MEKVQMIIKIQKVNDDLILTCQNATIFDIEKAVKEMMDKDFSVFEVREMKDLSPIN